MILATHARPWADSDTTAITTHVTGSPLPGGSEAEPLVPA